MILQKRLLAILATSYQAYENYTAPLGIGFMVRPNHHYGPDVDGYEYDRWGRITLRIERALASIER